ncbi:MAG: iron-containing alcohol dehydrogenase [Cyclobacteriaceae bacterium]
MNSIIINQPKKLVIAKDAINQLVDSLVDIQAKRVFVLTDPHVSQKVLSAFEALEKGEGKFEVVLSSGAEPTFAEVDEVVAKARAFNLDYVVGVGGGSVLDMAKLVAAMVDKSEGLRSFVGNGLIKHRNIPLACVPTTSGAGSESSPNAILIDESDHSKKGIIDAALMPDAVYIDPVLMVSLPPNITAYTGLDALTHCIEAFANKNAHPVVDVFALQGIKLISQNLGKTISNGADLEAREKVALGAYYGGMCLGPVNTAAVHALAYPLGTEYNIAHGLSNALLLPFVLEFNLKNAADRYAEIALAMGGKQLSSQKETALQGIDLIRKLIKDCGMPARLSELDITSESVEGMAEDALKIQRLLKNNVREVALQDAISIYQSAF